MAEHPTATATATVTVGVEFPASTEADGIAMTPDRIGDYVIVECLGVGAAGAVYSAYDPNLDRTVALKLLHGTEHSGAAEALLAEARALARLSHPNVVRVHDVGAHRRGDDEDVFMAMEYVDGSTLKRWLVGERRSAAEIRRVFVAAGRGLAAAHASGLVHRDFKPGNVMLANDGRVMVTDFGLARRDTETPTQKPPRDPDRDAAPIANAASTVHYAGTPMYMAPEQHEALRLDARADQFAFCVALWEAVCGQHPFEGDTVNALRDSVLAGRITAPPPGVLDSRTEAALRRGLSVEPGDRFPTMDELLAAVGVDPEQRRRRRRWMVAGVAVVAVTATVLGVRHQAAVAACEREASALSELRWPQAAETVETWTSLAYDNCRAEQAATREPKRVATVRACLAELRTDLEVLAELVPDDAARNEALATLPAVAACGDDEALNRREELRGDAPLDDVVRVRAELSRVRALALAGDLDEAEALAERAASIDGPAWLVAEAHVAQGRIESERGDPDAGELLERAYFTSIATGHDAIAARAAAALATTLTAPAEVHHWIREAELAGQAATAPVRPSASRRMPPQ